MKTHQLALCCIGGASFELVSNGGVASLLESVGALKLRGNCCKSQYEEEEPQKKKLRRGMSTEVYDQGTESTCFAHAGATVIRAAYRKWLSKNNGGKNNLENVLPQHETLRHELIQMRDPV